MNNQNLHIQEPKFSFSDQLTQAIKWIEQKDKIQNQIQHRPIIHQGKVDGQLKMLNQDLVRSYQTLDFLIYAFISWNGNLDSTLHLYYFSKENGQNQSKQIPTLKGKITAMQFTYPIQVIKQKKVKYQVKLVLGNTDGFIKIIDFRNNYEIQSFQIDTKSIVDIKVPPQQYFSNHEVCFALLEDYNIYTISLRRGVVIAHFRPTIMMCDSSLSLSLHDSMKYMLQSTKGGYLVLWKINENLYKKLQNQIPSSKSIQKIYNVFPTTIMHAASIQGLIWAQFLGDLIAIITAKGIFKIIAINIHQKEQFAVILQYQIQNGHTIKDAKLLPKQECLIVVKQQSGYNSSVIQCLFYSPDLLITRIFRVRCEKMPDIKGFNLSKKFKYILLRNNSRFLINLVTIFEDKIKENLIANDQIRRRLIA